ncbi:MAG TPA: clostripain-related cysteine peptidase [Candidatus Wallbacteria bacterium]|nr:clostripain-related cysteine peptidase [Candidatus Wallbacteria bacterium]
MEKYIKYNTKNRISINKKDGRINLRPYFILPALLIVLFSVIPSLAAEAPAWTYLVFFNDPDHKAPREINRLENICQGDFIKIIAMHMDAKSGLKTAYGICQDADPEKISSPVLSSAKINAGEDPVRAFYDFAVKYAAGIKDGSLMITFYDRDMVINNKMAEDFNHWKNVKNMRSALEKIVRATGRPVDILHFDANNFQCLELIYEFSDFAVNIIGSEELIPECGTPYDLMINPIISQKITASQRFSFLFVSGWHGFFKPLAGSGIKATLSAVKTAELPMVSEKMNIMIESLTAALNENKHRDIFVSSVIKKVRRYLDGQFIDAFDLGRLINEEIRDQNTEKSSREFLASLTNATIKNSAVGDLGKIPITYNSFGMSLYMPVPAPKFESYDSLAIVKQTGWKAFLDYFYSFSLQRTW